MMQFNGMDMYVHFVTCSTCNRESAVLHQDEEPWVLGVFWCRQCRVVQTIKPGQDRVVLSPTQLSLFPPGNATKG